MVPSLTTTGSNSGMSLKEVKRTAAVAWSPPLQTNPLLATGTLAGALDASFSTNAELEIHDLQLEDKGHDTLLTRASVTCPSRFNRLAWSAHAGASNDGVLIGGCEDGTVSFWSASDLLSQSNSETTLIARCEAHQGPVRGLQVNPFQPFLVASGATDAEIWLWDLNNLQQPYSPSATKSSKLEDVTDLAWNRIVPHILATASNSGVTVVWDLKSRKEVLQLSTPGQRVGMSAIAWNPENATQLLVASDDDQSPLIYSWDLRNARAPEKTLTGHAKGVLSLAWCPKDAELLLSCGKDSKSICWNPKSGQVVAELTHSNNWIFDVQWCPRNPDLFSTASFSGIVEVNSFQTIMSGGGSAAAAGAAATGTAEDFFAMASSGTMMAQRTAAPTHVQIPKWLRRPIGVSFGFGGRVISFSSLNAATSSPRLVSITPLMIPALAKVISEGKRLDMALSSQMLVDYCQEKIPRPIPNLHAADGEAIFWNVAKVLFESNPQEKLLTLLGFDQARLEEQIKRLCLSDEQSHQKRPSSGSQAAPERGTEKTRKQKQREEREETEANGQAMMGGGEESPKQYSPPNAAVRQHVSLAAEHDFFGGGLTNGAGEGILGGEGADFDFQSLVSNQEPEEMAVLSASASPTTPSPPTYEEGGQRKGMAMASDTATQDGGRRGTFDGVEFQLFSPECSDLDRTITKAIIQGNFEGAVDLCVRADRLSDALLVAICGGEQLVARTQQLYFRQSQHPYLRVVSAIVKRDLTDVVTHASVEDWEEILALICSYSSGPAFSHLCNLLAGRLEAALDRRGNNGRGASAPSSAAAAKGPAALICYMAAGNASKAIGLLLREASATGAIPDRHYEWLQYAAWLERLVEKTRIIEQVAGYVRGADQQQQQAPIQDALSEISDKFIEYSGLMASAGLLDIAVRYFNSFSSGRPLDGHGSEDGLVTDPVVLFGDQLAKAAKALGLPLRPIPEPFVSVVPVAMESAATMSAPAPSDSSALALQSGGSTAAPLRQFPSVHPHLQQQQQQQPWTTPNAAGATTVPFGAQSSMSGPQGPHPPSIMSYQQPQPPQPQPQSQPPQSQQQPPPVPPSQPSMQSSSQFAGPPLNSSMAPGMGRGVSSPQPMVSSFGAATTASGMGMGAGYGPTLAASQATAPIPMTASYGTGVPTPSSPPPPTTAIGTGSSPFIPLPRPIGSGMGAANVSGNPPSAMAVSPTGPVPSLMVPAPPRPVASSPPPSDISSSRRSVGAYNDPPMVAPRIPMGASAASAITASTAPLAANSAAMPTSHASTVPAAVGGPMSVPSHYASPAAAASAAPPATVAAKSPRTEKGPVDPSTIPPNLMPIYKTFSTLISQCQERALPMQRRVVEDSARRMQALFQQLVDQQLSPSVIQILMDMCAHINNGQYDRAHEMHTPLMTSYFAEAGAWVLAAKRLIEVAKISLH